MPQPLIHIGYHRTGTTWLQTLVFNDASLGFTTLSPDTTIDEAFIVMNPFTYDADRARERFARLLADADASDTVPVISHERLSGLPLSSGPEVPVIAERLKAAFPEGRVLIVIREQRDLMLSVYKHYVLRLGTQKLDRLFRERSIREQRMRRGTLDALEFHHLIAYYQRLFGRDGVLVLPYEWLHSDPTGFVGQIAKFVGRPAPASVPKERSNTSLPAFAVALLRYVNAGMDLFRLGGVFRGPVVESRARKGRIVALGKIGQIAPTGLSRNVDRRWRTKIDAIAGDTFDASNRITSELIGIDLAPLGYRVGS